MPSGRRHWLVTRLNEKLKKEVEMQQKAVKQANRPRSRR